MINCPGFSGTAFCSIRVPASLGPSPTLVCFCFSVLASLGQPLFRYGPGFSGSLPPYCVINCPGFSGTAFCSIRVPASLGPSPTLVCFCFSVLASLGQPLFRYGPGFSGSLPPYCVLFCPGFSGTAFVLLGTRLLWVPPPLLCD